MKSATIGFHHRISHHIDLATSSPLRFACTYVSIMVNSTLMMLMILYNFAEITASILLPLQERSEISFEELLAVLRYNAAI
jgi:hypothetical protein